MGQGPVKPLKTVASALDKDLARVKGMVFTHLTSTTSTACAISARASRSP
jgi:hypothetical protein